MSSNPRDLLAVAVITLSVVIVVVVLATAPASEGDRVEALARSLGCPVCESESIADSPSAIARDLYDLIAEQVADGWTDDQVTAFFVNSYGEEVLLDPPLDSRTLALWLVPALAVAVGIVVILRRRRPRDTRDLTADEQERLAAALDRPGDDE